MDGYIQLGILIPFALFLLVAIVLGGLLFVAAIFEKQHLLPLGEEALPSSRKPSSALAAARALEYHDLGCFRAAAGFPREYVNLLVSPDRQILAMTIHSKLPRFKLLSKLPDGRWLMTTDSGGEPDLAGLQPIDSLPTSFPHIVTFHRRRLERMNLTPLPFTPESSSVVTEFLEHERRRATALCKMGFARWRDEQHLAWSYRLPAAIRVTSTAVSSMFGAKKASDRTVAEGFPSR